MKKQVIDVNVPKKTLRKKIRELIEVLLGAMLAVGTMGLLVVFGLAIRMIPILLWCAISYVAFACLIGEMSVTIGGRPFDVWLLVGVAAGIVLPALSGGSKKSSK